MAAFSSLPLPAVVPALLLLFFAAFAPAPAAAATSSKRPSRPPPFPAGLAALQQHPAASSSGRCTTAAATAAAKPFTAHYFQQEVDHFTFTPNSSALFSQKYLLNDTFWRRKPTAGPLFVYTGNEGDIEWFAANTGFMFDIAPDFGALLVFIEHRFYGESKPFGNDSYLTSTRALADFAVLITSLKQNLSTVDAPVVVFGGSYGGMLASWFRLKYPHVAMGAVASSAPILQFDDITPWSSFYDTVSQDFKSESLNCFSVIKAVWDVLDDRGSNDTALGAQQNLQSLQDTGPMVLYSKIDKRIRLQSLFSLGEVTVHSIYPLGFWLTAAFTTTAMVDYPTPANFMMNLPAFPVKEMCKIIDSFPTGADVIDKAFAAASLYYNYTGNQKCFEVEGGDDPHGLPGWGWQAFTEMFMPMTVSNESMFPPSSFSYEKRSERCLLVYGVRPRMHWITTEYGGHKIDKVLKRFGSNIIFSNGMRDPWSRGGVHKNISSSIIALVTEKGAHHLDFRSATKDDPDWLVEQRRLEVEIVHGWINQYNKDISQM